MAYVHLNVLTGYSFMQSTVKINNLVTKASELGMSALAITDRNVMYGAIAFYQACKRAKINPIIGMRITVTINDDQEELILLAKNQVGYQALLEISSWIQLSEDEQISVDKLKELRKECFLILPTTINYLTISLAERDDRALSAFLTSWGEDCYVGLHYSQLNDYPFLHEQAIPMVGIGNVHYLNDDDQLAYHYLVKMAKQSVEDQELAPDFLFNDKQAQQLFKQTELLLNATVDLASQCHLELDLSQQLIPRFPVEETLTAKAKLTALTKQALIEKYGTNRKASQRLEHELTVIEKMDFSDYFLIVWDFVKYAKEQGILVGPGRGSAAGSLVAYLLNITTVDPIKYGLLFERFLNPDRLTMPDIDIDFSDQRRQEVIDYVKDKYGHQYVAQIGTFGTFKARSIIRELAKVYDLPENDLTYILNELPKQGSYSITDSVKRSPALIDYIKTTEHLQHFFKIARRLEGLPRNLSTHAAGVIIHDQKLTTKIPLTTDQLGHYLTQYPMGDLEKIGLLKIDFLGLRNLTTLEQIVRLVSKHGRQEINLDQIPLNDQRTFALLQLGKTNGVFQFESDGMKRVLKTLKPTEFADIVAVNALYRPGPMDFIPSFIKRKHGEEPVSYIHHDLVGILSPTYGVLIYQEQIIELTHQFAGLSYGQADILRRAISKKNAIEIDKMKQLFVSGCIKKGYAKAVADELFSWIERFADYGFNKSHAVAYSLIAYQLAYLKANFPVYFHTALLNTVTGQSERFTALIAEVKAEAINLLSPHINHSFYSFTVDSEGIRFGLLTIKGISYPVVNTIIQERQAGPFKNLFDFCLRVSLDIVTKDTIKLLIHAGAFDFTGIERASLVATIANAYEQGDLFGGLDDRSFLTQSGLELDGHYQSAPAYSIIEQLAFERDLLGIYVSDHPLSVNRSQLRGNGFVDILYLQSLNERKTIKFIGIVEQLKAIRTKRGDSMAFVTFSDEKESIEAVIFPDLFREVKLNLVDQQLAKVVGKVEQRQGKQQVIVQEIVMVTDLTAITNTKINKRLFIKVDEQRANQGFVTYLERIADQSPGNIPIIIYQQASGRTYRLPERFNMQDHYQVQKALKEYFGAENVVFQS
ncbi:DNA polymerase-3 subunit alpha [Amphibacillus marinus]|uniref:DNA polymerase III subunit alpha n=1 Tax=Amphibacillus marinus TaxID=872970 RepID=A0A1H8T2F3_9BACI|nr:DNA polymerase III subunit alpha [Amphibacillus marinus]SEO85239.1 DNA polymerase-3 subunit alpha [Amphibacillus marinus]